MIDGALVLGGDNALKILASEKGVRSQTDGRAVRADEWVVRYVLRVIQRQWEQPSGNPSWGEPTAQTADNKNLRQQ